MRTVTHHAFMAESHMEATTCKEAEGFLMKQYGPIHGTDWGCYYSETEKGWFRPKCNVIPASKVEQAKEKIEEFWGTAGGVFLILFIISICIFFIWWIYGCIKLRRFEWFWKVKKEMDYGRVTYQRQKNSQTADKYSVDNDDEDDVEDVYLAQ